MLYTYIMCNNSNNININRVERSLQILIRQSLIQFSVIFLVLGNHRKYDFFFYSFCVTHAFVCYVHIIYPVRLCLTTRKFIVTAYKPFRIADTNLKSIV